MKRILIGLLFSLSTIAYADVVVTATPTLDTGIYASGDNMGGKLTLSGALVDGNQSGIISNVVLVDKDKEAADIDVVFFSTDPSASTFTNNAAQALVDADAARIICAVSVTTDVAFSDNGISYALNQNCPFTGSVGPIYAALVARGTPTYTSASDLLLKVTILQDE